MPCSSWRRGERVRECLGTKRIDLVARALSLGPVRDRARATEMQRRASGSRDCRRSSGHMKTSRQAKDTIFRNVEVKLVSVTTPATEKLNLEPDWSSPIAERRALRVRMNSERRRGDESALEKRERLGEAGGWRTDGEFGAAAISYNDGDSATEWVGFGGRDSELHVLNIRLLEEPNTVACKVNGSIELRTITHRELAASQKSSPGQIFCGIEDGVVDVGKVTSDEPETNEDVESDGELGLAVPVALKSLDPPDDSLQCRGVADFKRKACIDMEGTNGGEVAFNGVVEDGAILAGEVSRPGHEAELSRREQLTRGGCILGVEPNKVEERSLGGGIGLPGGGSESVEEEKCDLSRQPLIVSIVLPHSQAVFNCVRDWSQSISRFIQAHTRLPSKADSKNLEIILVFSTRAKSKKEQGVKTLSEVK
ncbi:hypothetical protein GGX14DRAFT_402101 [Mycena pura]|uniref:Uncharacterized protein n=1 Tax=Mycena pura TaxID=153505 RepID=A0AAD6V2N7_9AGAR|nr:hypothetical protein GGX14DRAFT_402101 [Mycena pura]